MIEDLRRKDFIGVMTVGQKTITGPDFLGEFTAMCRAAVPFQKWLCEAVGVAW